MRGPKDIRMGISPGTRYIGIAVMKGRELVDYRIKTFKGKWSKEKLNRINQMITETIEQYQVSKIAMKIPHITRTSKALNNVVKTIEMTANRMRIPVKLYNIKKIQKLVSNGQRINCKEMMKLIADEYPILKPELEAIEKKRNKYYERMFEAVGLAFSH